MTQLPILTIPIDSSFPYKSLFWFAGFFILFANYELYDGWPRIDDCGREAGTAQTSWPWKGGYYNSENLVIRTSKIKSLALFFRLVPCSSGCFATQDATIPSASTPTEKCHRTSCRYTRGRMRPCENWPLWSGMWIRIRDGRALSSTLPWSTWVVEGVDARWIITLTVAWTSLLTTLASLLGKRLSNEGNRSYMLWTEGSRRFEDSGYVQVCDRWFPGH